MAERESKKNGENSTVQHQKEYTVNAISDKSWSLTLVLAIFFGAFGIHRFYTGKLCTGILYFCTVGCFFAGWLGDIIKIAMGNFTDSDGRYIRRTEK